MAEGDLTPKEIGGFRILRRLASGATSDVLLARAEGPHGFQRVVALKILLARPKDQPEFDRSFAADASAYARLSHPAVVKLYDFFSADGQLVMVLEYVDGLPLHKLRAMLASAGERIDDKAALFLGLRVFSALAAAHGARDSARGVAAPVGHYDINPSNILVPWDGQVKLGDFGIAHAAGIQADARTGFVKGTYGYSAPEQVASKDVSLRVDIYSAALILWELLARRKAVQRGTLTDAQVIKAMAHPEFPSLELLRPDLAPDVRAVIKRALEPDPTKRDVTAEEVVNVLRQAVSVEDGRKALAAALTRMKETVPGAGGASAVAAAAVDTRAASAPAAGQDERLDPEQTAPFEAVSDDGELGKIAFYGRIMLPVESNAPPAASPSGSPPAIPPFDAPTARYETLAAVPTGPPPAAGSPAISPSGPPRPVPRPAVDKKSSGFPTTPAPPLEDEVRREDVAPDVAARAPTPPLGDTLPIGDAQPAIAEAIAGALLASSSPASDPPAAAPAPAPPVPEPLPSAPAAPSTTRSPEIPPELAAEAAERRSASPPPTASRSNAPPYVPSSLPPPAKRRGVLPWVLGLGVLGAAAVGGAMFLLPSEPEQASVTPPVASTVVAARPAAPPNPAAASSAVAAATPSAAASAAPSAVASAPAPSASAASSMSASAASVASVASVASAPPAVSAPAAVAAAPALPSATPPVSPAAAAPAAAAPAAPVAESADMGVVELPASAAQHRIFVDGKVAGEGTAPLHLHCGSHMIKVGSAGTEKKVEVPCGGSIAFGS